MLSGEGLSALAYALLVDTEDKKLRLTAKKTLSKAYICDRKEAATLFTTAARVG